MTFYAVLHFGQCGKYSRIVYIITFSRLFFSFRQRQASVSEVPVEPNNERIPTPEEDGALSLGIPDTLPQKPDDAE